MTLQESELALEQVKTMIELARIAKEDIKKEILQLSELLQQRDIEIRNLRQQIPALEKEIQEEKKKLLLERKEIKDVHEAREILNHYLAEYPKAKEIYNKVIEARLIIQESEKEDNTN